LALAEKELQQEWKDNQVLIRYIHARRKKEEAWKNEEEAQKKEERDAQKEGGGGGSEEGDHVGGPMV
jgi:hypothetical protein